MTVTSALASFAVVAGLLTIIPGLDTALVLRAALTQSGAHAFATAFGIGTGSLLWGAGAAVGVSALLTASQLAFTVLRVAGAAFMLWMGATMLWRSRSGAVPDAAVPDAVLRQASLLAAWRRGVLTNLLNPKVGVFYVAVIPQFLPAGAPHLLMGLALALVHDVEGMVWFTLIIVLTGFARDRLSRPLVRRVIDRTAGIVLIGFATRLAANP